MAEKKESTGAMWLKKSKKGMTFMSGVFEVPEGYKAGDKVEIVVFKNDKGDNEKRPDYRIFESEPLDQSKPSQSSTDFDDDPPF